VIAGKEDAFPVELPGGHQPHLSLE